MRMLAVREPSVVHSSTDTDTDPLPVPDEADRWIQELAGVAVQEPVVLMERNLDVLSCAEKLMEEGVTLSESSSWAGFCWQPTNRATRSMMMGKRFIGFESIGKRVPGQERPPEKGFREPLRVHRRNSNQRRREILPQ